MTPLFLQGLFICVRPESGLPCSAVVQCRSNYRIGKGAGKMGEKKQSDIETFVKNVNKKDKQNGLKVNFHFVKRKRR